MIEELCVALTLMGSECETTELVVGEQVEETVGFPDLEAEAPTCSCDTRLKNVEARSTTLCVALIVLVVATAYAFAMTGMLISVKDYATHHYVHKNLRPLEDALEKQQQQMDSLTQDMNDRCVDAFMDDYLDAHPAIIVEPGNEYVSAVLEGVRIQAVLACTLTE